MRSLIILVHFCLYLQISFAQSFTVADQKSTINGEMYVFPVFNSTSKTKPQDTINRTLQHSELELIIGEEDSSVFEMILPPDGAITRMSYHVLTNTSKVLTVEFDKEFCNAYCESFSTYYNFDASTGELLRIKKMFSATGFQHVIKIVVDERVKNLTTVINKAHFEDKDEGQVDMYTECIELINDTSLFEHNSFYISNNEIHFLAGRCSSHAMRGIDEIGDFDNMLPFTKLKPYLSEYGRQILSVK